jgi:hypothetical protein
MSIINEINFYILYKRERRCLVQMSFGGHFDQPVPIAMHWPIGQVVPY